MEKVPPEVLSSILRYLDVRTSYHRDTPNPTWPKYVTVCSKWQHQIERFSVNEVLLTRQRIGYVRIIELGIRLPSYDEEARTRLKNPDEKRRNNEVFTRTVEEFFSFFEALSDCAPDNRVLKITAISPSDIWYRPCYDRTRRMRRSYLTKDICEVRFQHSYLELLHAPNWPIGVFSSFQILDQYYRSLRWRLISPIAYCQIASQLQTLTSIDWCLSDREKRDLALRAYLRDSFAGGLELLPDSLEIVKLQYTYPPPNNHDFAPARVSAGIDKLSVALRALCQRVKSADIEASVTSDFFWPSIATCMEPGALEPRQEWPHLQPLSLLAAAADPNGNWLCDRHCKYGAVDAAGVQEEQDEEEKDEEDEEEDEDYLRNGEPGTPADEDRRDNQFRGSPNERLISAWNIGIARAAREMPLLRDLRVIIPGVGPRPYRGGYRVTYAVADRRLKIQSTPVQVMDDALRDAWKEAAMTHGMLDGDVETELIESIQPS
ncbi:hypothetical protein PGQ11_010960 [Apiospora arundinis]|uniref:F-box domain-containing protein n=1 Tax=Apiospora arundinis TaxID=335852 RepID=A0ABR2HYU7_9PEZI